MHAPLAYKHVVTQVMLMEANYCASRLHLAVKLPITEQDIRGRFISPPHRLAMFGHRPLFGGRIDLDRYSLSFSESCTLRYITDSGHQWYAFDTDSEEMEAYCKASANRRCVLDGNGAYHMAASLLTAIDVDVERLNKDQLPGVKQMKRTIDTIPLPLFDVSWNRDFDFGNGKVFNMPVVSVFVAGDTGQLIHIKQNDDSYSRRPKELIKNVDKLLTIADAEFLKCTTEQKDSMVAEFGAVQYPSGPPTSP